MPVAALETLEVDFTLQFIRTYIRIRSPRSGASGQQVKVGKGSRQIRFVTLEQGLALRIVWVDPVIRLRQPKEAHAANIRSMFIVGRVARTAGSG